MCLTPDMLSSNPAPCFTTKNLTAWLIITHLDLTARLIITHLDLTARRIITHLDLTARLIITHLDLTARPIITHLDLTARLIITHLDLTARLIITHLDLTVHKEVKSCLNRFFLLNRAFQGVIDLAARDQPALVLNSPVMLTQFVSRSSFISSLNHCLFNFL